MIISIFFICAICVLLIIQNCRTPYTFLQGTTGHNSATSPNEFLYQANLGDSKYAVFYINANNNVSCAVVKKNIFSYEMLNISSEVLLNNSNKKADFFFSSYKNGIKREWIDWGVIRDCNIKQILVNNKEANLVDVESYNFRISYFTGNETNKKIPPTHLLNY